MSARTARRVATAGSLSLALALASPVAAFADHGEGKHGGNGSSQGTSSSSNKGNGSSQGTSSSNSSGSNSSSSSKGTSSSSSQGSSSSAGKGSTSSTGKSSSAGKRSDRAGDKSGSTRAQRADNGDPAGNNGTVKIDGLAFDDTPGNEPHVGCTFQLDFFGFDEGNTADITLNGHAPTGGGLMWSASNRLISTDAAGGGQDVDESITLTLSDLNLAGATPHPKQGYHVKLAVDVLQAPGGAKQKVFWISCPAAPGVAGTTSAPATGGGDEASNPVVVTRRTLKETAVAQTFGQGTTQVTNLAGTSVAGASLGGGAVQAASGAGQAETVSARGATRPSVLPFTGIEGLGYLLALGLSALGVGTVAHRLGRRRAPASI